MTTALPPLGERNIWGRPRRGRRGSGARLRPGPARAASEPEPPPPICATLVNRLRAGRADPAGLVGRPARLVAPGVRAIVRDIVAGTRTGSIILERAEDLAPRLLEAGYQFTTP
jgi:hypothetical protein